MHIFQGTTLNKDYWLFDIAVKCVLDSKNFEKDENEPNYGSNWYSELIAEIDKTINLAGSIKIDLYKRVKPIEIQKLLKEEWRCDFGLLVRDRYIGYG